jgi:hypothetical protein
MIWKIVLALIVGAGIGSFLGYDIGFERTAVIDEQIETRRESEEQDLAEEDADAILEQEIVVEDECTCTASPICSGVDWEGRDEQHLKNLDHCRAIKDMEMCALDGQCVSSCELKPCPIGIPSAQ